MGRGPQGFGRDRRLPDKAAFDRVFSGATLRLSQHPFLLLAVPGTAGCSRLGMVIGKRHARRAVDRNRIRRQVRESFRQRSIEPALDLVILARPGAGDCSTAMLASSISGLWARLERRLESATGDGDSDNGIGSGS